MKKSYTLLTVLVLEFFLVAALMVVTCFALSSVTVKFQGTITWTSTNNVNCEITGEILGSHVESTEEGIQTLSDDQTITLPKLEYNANSSPSADNLKAWAELALTFEKEGDDLTGSVQPIQLKITFKNLSDTRKIGVVWGQGEASAALANATETGDDNVSITTRGVRKDAFILPPQEEGSTENVKTLIITFKVKDRFKSISDWSFNFNFNLTDELSEEFPSDIPEESGYLYKYWQDVLMANVDDYYAFQVNSLKIVNDPSQLEGVDTTKPIQIGATDETGTTLRADDDENSDVFAFVSKNEETEMFDVVIYCEQELYAPVNSAGLFSVPCENGSIEEIEKYGDDGLMYYGFGMINEIDISLLKTDNVENMWGMFIYCGIEPSGGTYPVLDLSSFITSNVTDMSLMFCVATPNLNLSSFDTSKVEKMNCMFFGLAMENDEAEINLDISSFSFDSLTEKGIFDPESELDYGIFYYTNLSSIKIPKTIKEGISIDLNGYFYVQGGDENKVYSELSSELNTTGDFITLVPGIDPNGYIQSSWKDKISNLDSNANQYKITKITLLTGDATIPDGYVASGSVATNKKGNSSFVFTSVENDKIQDVTLYLYENSSKTGYYEIILYSVNKISVSDSASQLFYSMTALEEIVFNNNLDLSKADNFYGMFSSCSKLTSVDLSGFNAPMMQRIDSMFSNCSSLESVKLPTNSFVITELERLFYNCQNLTSVDFGGMKIGLITSNSYKKDVFTNCIRLETIKAPVEIKTEIELDGTYSNGSTTYTSLSSACQGQTLTRQAENIAYLNTSWRSISSDAGSFNSSYFVKNSNYYKIETITFSNTLPTGYDSETTAIFSVGAANAGASGSGYNNVAYFDGCLVKDITAYIFMRNESGGYSCDITFYSEAPIYAQKYSYGLFTGLNYLTTINSFNLLNTSKATNISYMFSECSRLESIDLSGFNTENVTSMSNMFNGCSKLTSLDLSEFDLTNCTYDGAVSGMFKNCSSLVSLKTPKTIPNGVGVELYGVWNNGTQELVEITNSTLETTITRSLQIESASYLSSNWRYTVDSTYTNSTKSISFTSTQPEEETYVASYSVGIPTAQSYSYTSWNESNGFSSNDVTAYVFENSEGGYNIVFYSPVTIYAPYDADYLFGNSSATSIDLTGLNTSRTAKMDQMFENCSNLTSLTFGSTFNTSIVRDMSCMFRNCSSIQNLDLTGFNTENVTTIQQMFYGCSSLTSLDLSSFNTGKVTDMDYMFYGCSNLENINFGNDFSTENVTTIDSMFYGCSSLTSLDLSSFNTTSLQNSLYSVFENCSALQTLDISSWNISLDYIDEDILTGCNALETIYAPTISSSANMSLPHAFYDEDDSTQTRLTKLSTQTNGKTLKKKA